VRLVERCLVRSGYAAAAAGPVGAWLDEVVRCPLAVPGGGEVRLAAIAPASMARELEFQLPARRVDDRALVGAVAREYPLQAQAAASSWSGFLHGFVDLVFEHEGRWHLVDWKSNKLGEHASDYRPAALERSIDEHAYALQFCLYTLALHRLLRRRVPGYAYERHFGAVHYVYLRGAGDPAADPGESPGLYTTRPSAVLVDTLDRLFEAAK
jgi:exodeoxyribonuclease V beta subunit